MLITLPHVLVITPRPDRNIPQEQLTWNDVDIEIKCPYNRTSLEWRPCMNYEECTHILTEDELADGEGSCSESATGQHVYIEGSHGFIPTDQCFAQTSLAEDDRVMAEQVCKPSDIGEHQVSIHVDEEYCDLELWKKVAA